MTVEHSLELPWSSAPQRLLTELARTDRPVPPGDPIHLPLDGVCRLLSNSRRRIVIDEIAALETGEHAGIGVLAKRIAATEHEIDPNRVTSGQRKSAYVSLLQCHLPKLDDAGVIDWDRRSGEIARGDSIDELADLIETIDGVCAR